MPPAVDLSDFDTGQAAWRQFRRPNYSTVTRLFHGLLQSALSCSTCGFDSAAFDTFSLLPLPLAVPVEGMDSLYHSLDQCVRDDFITDWTCPKCRQRRNVHKEINIWRFPPVVILHLEVQF